VALGQLGHHWNGRPRVGESDGLGQRQQAAYRHRLVGGIETKKRAREVPPGSADGRTAGPVVPIRRGVTLALLVEADEEFFDQEPVIEDDRRDGGHLLIGQVWVLDAGEAGLVAVSEHVAEFAACGLHAARDDQGGVAEIDDPYFAAVFDAPPMAKLGRQIGLAAVRHFGRRGTGHACIVLRAERQSVATSTMKFSKTLVRVRAAAGLTQAELAARSGVARPNIAAFEAGRRDPRWATATRTLEAAGAVVEVVEPITWSWTTGRRPYAVPSRLWRLPLHDAFRVVTPELHLWWSGPAPRLDLASRTDRARAYELVLREGRPEDIRSIVDGALLIETWPDLMLPAELRRAWQAVVDRSLSSLAEAS
jgi:transcriptional regulator with XRE-family HTH domain